MSGSTDRIEGNALIVFRRIVADGKPIGMIYIRSNFSEIPRRLRSYALIVFGVLAASLVLAMAFSSALHKKIAAPLELILANGEQLRIRNGVDAATFRLVLDVVRR